MPLVAATVWAAAAVITAASAAAAVIVTVPGKLGTGAPTIPANTLSATGWRVCDEFAAVERERVE